MVSAAGNALWAAAWVKAGVTGAILLFVVGGYIGARGKRMARELAQIASTDPSATRFPRHDAQTHALGSMNFGIALGVVGAMATKPTTNLGAFAIVAICALLGLVWSTRSAHAAEPVADFAE